MLDTYEKYKKGYILSDDAKEYEEIHKEAASKIAEISEKAKQRSDYEWLNQIPKVEKVIEKNKIQDEAQK